MALGRSARPARRTTAVAIAALISAGLVVTGGEAQAAPAAAETTTSSTCQLGNGIQHVINLVFDNVHFARDNPNVPSDLEQMPHLMNFLKQNGTVMSNLHTPMIAHTADDSLSIYTGLYGDRHGQPLSNSYKTYNPDGTTDPAASFAYWTSPVADTRGTPTAGHDTTPSMVYSDTVPASGAPDRQTPAPWVPFTRAGCNVGDFSTANMVLENAKVDLPTIFGPNSPEVAQYNADPDSFKDAEVADYIGAAVHCAHGSAVCADAQAVKFGQTTPTPVGGLTVLPTEPGGYHGFQALFGAKYVAPQLGAGTPNLTHNGHAVTDANGNLVDLDGNTIAEPFSGKPGFPGFSPTASQSLAYLADMQENGIPITYGYISDLHERKAFDHGPCTTPTRPARASRSAPVTVLPGTPTPTTGPSRRSSSVSRRTASTGQHAVRDQRRGERPVLRRQHRSGATPTPADCDGVTVSCSYPPARSVSSRPTSRACCRPRERRHGVRHGAAGCVDVRARPARPTMRPCGSWSATRPR